MSGVFISYRRADAQGWAPLHQVALTRSPHHDNVAPQPVPTGPNS